ncbi:hypothetical protein CALVIDRAFT_286208 [Calocera viscosa TUFC12733]|uniref:Uncharacterized protein n=1 Tax=Calocera viscosa (strain TUFC12733) TaxID=1330018 RepID=A0A167IV51_CALVF|nr:hypothetical protein CALVIDRAFT_286208 [Calocera viscosa TUFC12733]
MGATVHGLPKRTALLSDGKYYLTINIDGKEVWKSREAKPKESVLGWQGEGDKAEWERALTSVLRVTLYQNRRLRNKEALGAVELPLSSWLDATDAIPFVSSSTSTSRSQIFVSLSLVHDLTPTREVRMNDALVRQAVELGTEDAGAMRTLGDSDKVAQVGQTTPDVAGALLPLLDKLEWFMNAMELVTEVHPYSKMAWLAISAAYKVVKAQRARDTKILELVKKMTGVYDLGLEAEELRERVQNPDLGRYRERALCALAKQTKECGNFISTYASRREFFARMIQHNAAYVNGMIDQYSKSFDALLQDFRDGSQLQVEIVTFRMLVDIQDLSTYCCCEHPGMTDH